MNEVEAELGAAIDVARKALAEFNKEPLIASKRGGPRLSPWWRVYKEASEVAARWHREVARNKPDERSIDDELDRLLGADG